MKTREIAWHMSLPFFILDLWDRYEEEEGELHARVRPKGNLLFELVARWRGRRRVTLPQPLRLAMTRNPNGYWIFFGDVTLAGGLRRNWRYIQPGTYVLRVSERDEIYAPFEQDVVIPARDSQPDMDDEAERKKNRTDDVPIYKIALPAGPLHPSKIEPKPN